MILAYLSLLVAWLDQSHPDYARCEEARFPWSAKQSLAVNSVTSAELAAGGRTREAVDEDLRLLQRVDPDREAGCEARLALGRADPRGLDALSTGSLRGASADSLAWVGLPPLPAPLGFGGPFVGTHQGTLLVAGGANFPDRPPWEGGLKAWHAGVFALGQPNGAWKQAGQLPRPVGYGVSLSTKCGVVCLGGSDAQRHYADAFLLRWERGEVQTTPLPPLPKPCANFCGMLLDRTIYVAGGLEEPAATNALRTFWSLDLNSAQPRWQELEPWPGPGRMLAVAAVQGDAFFLLSGVALSGDAQGKPVRRYLRDAYRFEPGRGWKRLTDLPRAAAAAPTPAPAFGRSRFLILGGDDGSRANYQPPERHPGFAKTLLAYHTQTDTWTSLGAMPAAPVTTTITYWHEGFVLPTGEIRPGVRSPAIWHLRAAAPSHGPLRVRPENPRAE